MVVGGGGKWLRPGSGWLRVAPGGSRWLWVAPGGSAWLRVAPEVTERYWKLLLRQCSAYSGKGRTTAAQ